MACPSCGHDNREHANFCESCGSSLRQERDPRGYTPKHLADRILHQRSALEGERKEVTVLFTDVRGSTGLASSVDPEEWHRILDGFFSILTEGVHRFEGTVNQYTGDGIMALFGAPIAHEDHARRACLAAIHIREALRPFAEGLQRRRGMAFGVRTGLNSGEVVVGKIGDDLRMDYTAQGTTVALAARIEELAEPGRILLSASTARLVEPFAELEAHGERSLRGFDAPVEVFELGAVREASGPLDARDLSLLVGREAELEVLRAALAAALDGNGQVVELVGEPGAGKTRLCHELVGQCNREGVAAWVARCPSHARNVPHLLIRSLLARYFALPAEGADEALSQKLAELRIPLDPAFSLLADLLELPVEDPGPPPLPAAERAAALAELVRRLVQSQSAAAPAMFVLDDLHWADAESEALAAEMVDALGWTRTLLVLSYRPEYTPKWTRGENARQLHIGPLEADAARALVRGLLGEDASVGSLGARVLERTGGNALFVEETVRSLVAAGALDGERGAYRAAGEIDALDIPSSVRAVLAARVDALGEREKRLIQLASVIGDFADAALLARVADVPAVEVDRSVCVLEASGLARESDFAHPLLREVSYQSQLVERRRALHESVAHAIEELHPDDLGRQAALIAHHWESAGKSRIGRRWRQRAALRVAHIQVRRPPDREC